MGDTIRVRIWHGRYGYGANRDYPENPDEVIEIEDGHTHLYAEDPYYDSGPIAFDIHPNDTPATLYIYTNDSVREPPVQQARVDTGEWGDPVERGLEFDPDRHDDYPPFACEIWGRVLFKVDSGFTRR